MNGFVPLTLLLVLTASGCAHTAAKSHSPADIPAGNTYVGPLREQRAKWRDAGIDDYVFVLDLDRQGRSVDTIQMRVVVEDGRVVSASSLLYGGSAAHPEQVSTIDGLFDEAEQLAMSGDRGIPFHFEIEHDETYGYPRRVAADGRESVADDEGGFVITCFDTDPEGCAAVLLTAEQCSSAGGSVEQAGFGGCSNGGWSVGLLSPSEMCCRKLAQ